MSMDGDELGSRVFINEVARTNGTDVGEISIRYHADELFLLDRRENEFKSFSKDYSGKVMQYNLFYFMSFIFAAAT